MEMGSCVDLLLDSSLHHSLDTPLSQIDDTVRRYEHEQHHYLWDSKASMAGVLVRRQSEDVPRRSKIVLSLPGQAHNDSWRGSHG